MQVNKKHSKMFNPLNKPKDKLYLSKEGIYVDLLESDLFNLRLLSTSDSDSQMDIDTFVNRFFELNNVTYRKKMETVRKKTYNNILSNIIRSYNRNRVVAVSRQSKNFNGYRAHGFPHYTYTIVKDCLDHLIDSGFIEMVQGFYNRETKKGRMSRIWATNKLITTFIPPLRTNVSMHKNLILLESKNDKVATIAPMFYEVSYSNPIILKDKHKDIIRYNQLVRSTKRMKVQLIKYNEFMDKQSITIPVGLEGRIWYEQSSTVHGGYSADIDIAVVVDVIIDENNNNDQPRVQ